MCARCDPPDPVQAGQVSMSPIPPSRGDLASAGCCGRADEMRGAAWLPRYRVLAAGVAVAVAVCLSFAGTARVMSSPAMPGSQVVRAMALRFADDDPGCPQPPGPGRPPERWDEFASRARSASQPGLSQGSSSIYPGQPGNGVTSIRTSGAHRTTTVPDMACLLAYHGPPRESWRL